MADSRSLHRQPERVEVGQLWRRKKDGVLFEVNHFGSAFDPERVQVRRADAKNLKNTHWLWASNLRALYEFKQPGEFKVIYLRPDGWWEAGRGWQDRRDAEEDARKQLPENVEWRVVGVRPGG